MTETFLRWARWLMYFLLATTPFVISPVTVDSYLLPKYVWLSMWGALWLFLIVVQVSPRTIRFSSLDWPIATLVFVKLLSVIINYHSANQWRALMTLILYVGFFYAFQRYWRQGGCVHPIARILLIVCAGLSIYGILQDYGIDFYEKQSRILDWRMQVIATLGNPNFLSGFLMIAFPVLFAYGLRRNASWLNFVFTWIIVILVMACHTVTFCVGSTIGLVVTIFALSAIAVIQKQSIQFPIVRFILLLIGCVFALGWYLADNPYNSHGRSLYLKARESPQWASGAGARRFNWRTTRYMINEEPVTGIGFGNYEAKHLHYQGINYEKQGHPHDRDFVILVDQPHFQLLETAAEVGPLGVLILFWLFCAWMKVSLQKLKYDKNPWFAWGAFAGCWIAIVHSFSSFPFHLPANAFLFVMLASYLGVDQRQTTTARREPRPPKSNDVTARRETRPPKSNDVTARRETRPPKSNDVSARQETRPPQEYCSPKETSAVSKGLQILCFVFAALFALQAYLQFASNQYLRRGYESQGLQSVIHLETAKRLNPFDPQVYFTLGVRAIEEGWYNRAEEALKQGLEFREDHTSHKYLARIYMEQENLQKTIEQQRRVIELNPAYPNHYQELAKMLRQAGKQDEAQRLEEKAQRMAEKLRQQ